MSEAPNSKDEYGLTRDAAETARLDRQHQWMTRMYSFLIHPAIPTTAFNLRVADISCGSGAWIVDVATHFPNAQCDGFDISSEQFPSAASLEKSGQQSRVDFYVSDAADPNGPPPGYEHYFDIVAVRLMHINIVGAQWDQCVRNVVSMTKPGGWIQWIDWDPRITRVVQLEPLAPTSGMDSILEGFHEFVATRDTGATERIPAMLASNGVKVLRSEIYPGDQDEATRFEFSEQMLESFPRVASKVLLPKENGRWDEKRLKAVSAQAAKDE